MEKNTTRVGTGNQRLLAFKQLIRLAALFFLFCAAAILYGQSSHTFIEFKRGGEELSLDREFEIEVIIKHDAPYPYAQSDTPRFVLGHEEKVAQLIQSSAIPEGDGLHLRYRYRFNTIGTFRFEPELRWKRQTLTLTPLDITVHQPLLSEHTRFEWKLYSSNGLPVVEDVTLEQGTEYILCLTAAFYSAEYAERYWHALQTASIQGESLRSKILRSQAQRTQADKTESGAGRLDMPIELPLPKEILRIECAPSESAALKPLALAELPFDAAVLAHSAAVPPQPGQYGGAGGERYILAIFSLIPLRIGVQSFPQAQIWFATGSEAFSVSATYRVERQKRTEAAGTGSAGGFTAAAFQQPLAETHDSGSVLSEQEKSAAATQVAAYRKQEAASLFSPVIRRKREALEATLGITHPLPLYPRLLGVTTAVITGLALIGAAVCGLRNKKWLMMLLIATGLCSGSLTALLFQRIRQPQGVYTGESGNAAVRRIPESTGSSVYQLSIGESVLLLRKAQCWYYIKTAAGVTGWVSPQSLIQYN